MQKDSFEKGGKIRVHPLEHKWEMRTASIAARAPGQSTAGPGKGRKFPDG